MDPDEALRIIRLTIRQMRVEDPGPPQEAPTYVQHARDLAEHVEALDEWLTKGGFPPAVWRGPWPMTCLHCGATLYEQPNRHGRYRWTDRDDGTDTYGSGSECPSNERGHEPAKTTPRT